MLLLDLFAYIKLLKFYLVYLQLAFVDIHIIAFTLCNEQDKVVNFLNIITRHGLTKRSELPNKVSNGKLLLASNRLNRPFLLVNFVLSILDHIVFSTEFSFRFFISYACTCIRWYLKVTVPWSKMTWSDMENTEASLSCEHTS